MFLNLLCHAQGCDYLSGTNIAVCLWSGTMLRLTLANYFAPSLNLKFIDEFFRLYPELVEGFVLAPNKDLAVSF